MLTETDLTPEEIEAEFKELKNSLESVYEDRLCDLREWFSEEVEKLYIIKEKRLKAFDATP